MMILLRKNLAMAIGFYGPHAIGKSQYAFAAFRIFGFAKIAMVRPEGFEPPT